VIVSLDQLFGDGAFKSKNAVPILEWSGYRAYKEYLRWVHKTFPYDVLLERAQIKVGTLLIDPESKPNIVIYPIRTEDQASYVRSLGGEVVRICRGGRHNTVEVDITEKILPDDWVDHTIHNCEPSLSCLYMQVDYIVSIIETVDRLQIPADSSDRKEA
jgi:hypothetical protein